MSTPIIVKAKDYSASAAEANLRTLMGGLLSADWMEAMIARGLGWHTFDGAFSTPGAGGGSAAIVELVRPRLLVSVPDGTTLVPLRIDCQLQTPLTAADSDESEILFAVDRTQAWGGVGTSTLLTPTNMRSDLVTGCPLTFAKTFTTDITGTVPVLGVELAHAVKVSEYATDVGRVWNEIVLLYEPDSPPFIVGPAMLLVYFGGTVATSGFVELDALAFPSVLVTDLS